MVLIWIPVLGFVLKNLNSYATNTVQSHISSSVLGKSLKFSSSSLCFQLLSVNQSPRWTTFGNRCRFFNSLGNRCPFCCVTKCHSSKATAAQCHELTEFIKLRPSLSESVTFKNANKSVNNGCNFMNSCSSLVTDSTCEFVQRLAIRE